MGRVPWLRVFVVCCVRVMDVLPGSFRGRPQLSETVGNVCCSRIHSGLSECWKSSTGVILGFLWIKPRYSRDRQGLLPLLLFLVSGFCRRLGAITTSHSKVILPYSVAYTSVVGTTHAILKFFVFHGGPYQHFELTPSPSIEVAGLWSGSDLSKAALNAMPFRVTCMRSHILLVCSPS